MGRGTGGHFAAPPEPDATAREHHAACRAPPRRGTSSRRNEPISAIRWAVRSGTCSGAIARACSAEDPLDRIAADMEQFFALHEKRWSAEDGGSTLARGVVQAFHADFAAAALRHGWLRLWFLEAEGRDVAAWYGWRVGERYPTSTVGGTRLVPRQRRSGGLMAHTVRSAIEEGAREYNFLLGNEDYKSRFASAYRLVETVVLARTCDAAQLVMVDRGIRRVADRLPRGLRDGCAMAAPSWWTVFPAQGSAEGAVASAHRSSVEPTA